MSEYEGKCPRCGSLSANYGLILISVGKTRKAKAAVNVCSKCNLLFYEFKQPQ